MTTLLNGVLGGLVVGVLATVAASRTRSGRPNTTDTPETADGGGTRWLLLGAGVLYGTAAGGVLVALDLFVLDVLSVPPMVWEALGLAVGWSVVLFAGALALVRFLPRTVTDRYGLDTLLVYHLLFGLGFALWVRLTWLT